MKKVLYVGNKLEKWGHSPTAADSIARLLENEHVQIKAISTKKNKVLRMLDMLAHAQFAKYDLIIIDTYSTLNFWYAVGCATIARARAKDYGFVLHGGNLDVRLQNSSSRILKLFSAAKFDIVPSAFLMERLKEFEVQPIIQIPNPILLEEYRFQKRNRIKPRLLWVRAFDKIYNPMLAIRVLENLLEIYPEAELCMVGPDKDGTKSELEHYVLKYKLPVLFTGKLNKTEWINLSEEYDVFINTTNIDNTPVSVIEAMALGLPVVSTNVGGIPYLIDHNENGILVEERDPEAMTSAIIELLNDPEKVGKLSYNGRLTAETHDWAKVKHLWLELLT